MVSDVIPLGSTTIEILKDSLHAPRVAITKNDEDIEDQDEVCFLKKTILDGNYRELQEINHREVHFFDRKKNCLHQLHHRRGSSGHYEQITRNFQDYIWVPHHKPSGLDNSFVVPDEEVPEEDKRMNQDDESETKNSINSITNMNALIDKTKFN